MKEFDYEGLPDPEDVRIDPLPDAVISKAQDLLSIILEQDLAISREIRMGRIYDRRGSFNIDGVGEPRNTSYGSSDDDLLVTVSLRVPAHKLRSTAGCHLSEIDHEVREIEEAKKRAALQAELDAEIERENTAKERARKLREELDKL